MTPDKLMLKTTYKLQIIIIILASIAVYINTLNNGFVYDDDVQILENYWIKDVRHIPDFFFTDVWTFYGEGGISSYYRPMMHLIFMAAYYVFGLKPWGFHLVNILFHAGISTLVFIIILQHLKNLRSGDSASHLLPSLIAALLFAVHPIHTEVVAWVSAIPELSYTFFYLLSLYLYMRSTSGDRLSTGGYVLSVASFFLAVFCKEPALTLPVILIAYDFLFNKERFNFSGNLKRYVPYFIVAGVYFIMRFNALQGFAPLKKHVYLNGYEYFINVFPLFVQYLQKLVLPTNLNAFHVLHPIFSVFEPKGIISLILTVVFLFFFFIAFKKNKTAFFSLLIIVIPLLPSLYIPGVGENTFGERYLYLPSVGFVFLPALLIQWVKINKSRLAIPLTVILAVVICVYSIGAINRNTVWKDDYTLWSDTVKKSPDGVIPHTALGDTFLFMGMTDKAIAQYQIALELKPNYHAARLNLGAAYARKGLTDKAMEQYQIALRSKPNSAGTYVNIGAIHAGKGLIDKAIEQYQIALRLNPNSVGAYISLGDAYSNKGWTDKAIEQYQNALRIDPDYADAYNNLGIAYGEKGAIDKAIENFEAAVKLKPTDPDFHNNLARAYELKGLTMKAEEQRRIMKTLENR